MNIPPSTKWCFGTTLLGTWYAHVFAFTVAFYFAFLLFLLSFFAHLTCQSTPHSDPTRAERALSCINIYSPHFLAHFPRIAAMDATVGNPSLMTFNLTSSFFTAGTDDVMIDKSVSIPTNPNVLKYLYDLSQVGYLSGS